MIVQVRVRHRGFYLSALNFCWNLSETVTLTAMTPRMRTTTRTKMVMTQTSTSNLISTTQKVVDDANARGPLLEFVLVLKQKLSHSGWCCIPTNCLFPPKPTQYTKTRYANSKNMIHNIFRSSLFDHQCYQIQLPSSLIAHIFAPLLCKKGNMMNAVLRLN